MKKQRKTRVAVTKELYNSVKGYKNAIGYTQRDVAKAWDVSQPTVSDIYRSKNFKQYKLRNERQEELDNRPSLTSESLERLEIIKKINVLLNKLV